MAHVLTQQNEQFIARLIQTGRYNNRSEVVRAGLRLLEEKECDYLNPPPLAEGELERAYRRQSRQEKAEEAAAVEASIHR